MESRKERKDTDLEKLYEKSDFGKDFKAKQLEW